MAKFRKIETSFWSDTYIQEEMSAEDKYFYLYLMTNEYTKQIGIYSISKKQMSFDLGYSIESVKALLQRFENHHKLIKYDSETREIILLNWAKNNLNVGGKPVQDLIKKEIKEIKNKDFLFLMYENCPENELKKFIKNIIFTNEHEEDYDSSDDSYNDTPTRNKKEEIINKNKELISNKEILSNTESLNNNNIKKETTSNEVEKKSCLRQKSLYRKEKEEELTLEACKIIGSSNYSKEIKDKIANWWFYTKPKAINKKLETNRSLVTLLKRDYIFLSPHLDEFLSWADERKWIDLLPGAFESFMRNKKAEERIKNPVKSYAERKQEEEKEKHLDNLLKGAVNI
ncbi:MAG: hypothetical protein MSH33_03620 [Fusobacterium necrophorum]|nr:hypothetical protein [Fusobacterium necrophorum]